MAVNRRGKGKDGENQADFINVTAWRGLAEFITRHFRKAASICVVGAIQTRSWTDPQGQKHYATEVVADEAYFVDSKGEAAQPSSQYVPEQYTSGGFRQEGDGDEDLPF